MLVMEGHAGSIHTLVFAPDGETLVSTGKEGGLRIWSPPVMVREIPTDGKEVFHVSFTSDGQRIAYARADKFIYVCRPDGSSVLSLPPQRLTTTGLAFIPNDDTLLIALGDRLGTTFLPKPLILWDLKANIVKPFNSGISNGIHTVAAHRGKRLLGWVTDAHHCEVRDITKPTSLFRASLKADARQMAFSPDGSLLAVAANWKIHLFHLGRKEELETLSHKGIVSSLAFTPDGRRLLSGSWDQTVKIWDTQTGAEKASYNWELGRITTLTIAPDGLRAAAGGDRGLIVIWDVEE